MMNVQTMKLKVAVVLFFALPVLFMTGCGGDEKAAAKSMEQIRSEEGIPVKVEVLKYRPFKKYYSFFAKLSGIKEATKGALVGGRIEKINAKVGDAVKKDQIIVQFAEDNPGIQYVQAKNAFLNAEKTYNRMKALLEAGEIAQAKFDGAETQYLVAKRNYEAMRQMLFVEAPFNGTIVDIKVNEGDNVNKDTHLFAVSQLNKMHAKVWATEDEIINIKRGKKTEINFNGKSYTGRVVETSMAADPIKQAFYAEVEFENPKFELKSGVTVDIKVLIYNNQNAIIIPRNLIMTDEKGTYVFLEKNGAAEKKYVSNGNGSGINYEIKSGLKPGDKLIIEGGALLADGNKVKTIQ